MQVYLIHFHEEREKEMEQGKPAAQCWLRIKIIGQLLELTDDQNDEIRDILDDVIGDEEEYGKD